MLFRHDMTSKLTEKNPYKTEWIEELKEVPQYSR